jgi:cytochrome c oxidase accessory protein FixG
MTVSQATPTTVHLPQLPIAALAESAQASDPHDPLLRPEGRVLSTLNPDGSRRWLEPKLSTGRFWQRRRIVAWILIIVFAAIPWIRINEKPAILLDVMTRKFVFFGTTFRPTDTLLLALLLLSIFVGIFLLTALFGRVWCGWACPQTVYMEFLYRPIERLFLGKGYGNRKVTVAAWRRVAMYAVFLLASAHLANTFLAYFVGTDRLIEWTLRSPAEHPTAFAIFIVTTGLMMFDFCFFREQMCTLVCPYGRFQSVLLDKGSLIVGYDNRRGEPRRAARAGANRSAETATPTLADAGTATVEPTKTGDCINCTLCVQTCPTGIDIRDGLQLECIHCAQCIDACDAVMDKIGKPRGLIRYSSQNALEGQTTKKLRIRVFAYPLLLATILSALVALLMTRADAMVVQLRVQATPYTVESDGAIVNVVRVRIDNRTEVPKTYRIEGTESARLREPMEVTVDGIASTEATFHVISRPEDFERGHRSAKIRVTDGEQFEELKEISLIGPFGSLGGNARGATP